MTYLIGRIAYSILSFLQLALFLRALSSWFPQVRGSKFGTMLYALTEPMVAPVRNQLQKIPALRQMPIDFSVLIVFLLLSFLQRLVMFY